jgi:hypothetical protein
MIEMKQNGLSITIPTPYPADTLSELQIGIIEMVKTILSIGREGRDLEVDRPTANGCVSVLDLLAATLIDSKVLETVTYISDQMTNFTNRVSQMRSSLMEVLPRATNWLREAESWPVTES